MRRELALFSLAALTAHVGCVLSLKEYPVGEGGAGATAGSGGSGGSSGSGGGGGSAELAGFSERCSADKPCEEGLTCWAEDATPWGPAGGLCTKPCSTSTDCPGTAHCFGGYGYCFEGCTLGDGNTNKCAGRRELGCARIEKVQGIDACIPACSDDADCAASGRICDRSIAMCAAGAHAGKPVGELCMANGNDCRGECEGVCGEVCVVGAPKSCDQSAVSSTVLADCVGSGAPDTGIQEEVGDLAFCAKRCECQSECPLDIMVCATSPSASTPHCILDGENTTPTLCRL